MADDAVDEPPAPLPPPRPGRPSGATGPMATPPLVEQLSLASLGSPHAAATRHHSNARPLSRSSLESTMMELVQVSQGVSVQASATLQVEPDNSLRRPFWVLKLVRTTITTGGFVTPRFHVPRLVWEQYGAKLNGLATKTSAFETVLALLVNRVLPLELVAADSTDDVAQDDLAKVQRALHVFQGLRAELDALQNTLARPFPFIKEVAATSTSMSVKSAAGGSSTPGTSASDGGGGGIQQFRGLMASLGKKVRKSAVSAYTAYERMGVALPAKIGDDELVSYSSLVAEMCDKAQALDQWFVCLDARRKALQESLGRDGGTNENEAVHQCVEGILVEFVACARFLQEVVVELLLRDLDSLVESYLRKMRKTFARMTWELEEPDGL